MEIIHDLCKEGFHAESTRREFRSTVRIELCTSYSQKYIIDRNFIYGDVIDRRVENVGDVIDGGEEFGTGRGRGEEERSQPANATQRTAQIITIVRTRR